jgi:hypothetical protein
MDMMPTLTVFAQILNIEVRITGFTSHLNARFKKIIFELPNTCVERLKLTYQYSRSHKKS